MSSDITAGLFGLAGVLSGGALTALLTQRADRLRYEREDTARHLNHQLEAEARREAYEAATLSDISNILERTWPKLSPIISERRRWLESATPPRPTDVAPTEIGALWKEADALNYLIFRLAEGEIREQCKAAIVALTAATFFEDSTESEQVTREANRSYTAALQTVNRRLGELARL